jgi:hypothetical protein
VDQDRAAKANPEHNDHLPHECPPFANVLYVLGRHAARVPAGATKVRRRGYGWLMTPRSMSRILLAVAGILLLMNLQLLTTHVPREFPLIGIVADLALGVAAYVMTVHK